MEQPEGGVRRQYLLRERIGSGGFGEVYRATLSTGSLETDVAVKLLRAERATSDLAAHRLRDEARFLALLRHPNIVRVLDLVKLGGRLALVTEFVDGEDLRTIQTRTGPLSVRPVLEIVARIADALNAASTTPGQEGGEPMKLIHRDIKPANILVSSHGRVKLVDFGVARTDVLERNAETAAHSMVGSTATIAPELVLRRPPSEASDTWGLAATAFHALTGEKLFRDLDFRRVANLVGLGEPRAFVLERIEPMAVPEDVRELLRDMLQIPPESRPSHLEVMVRADDLAQRVQGVTMRRWALDRDWAPHEIKKGDLTGVTLVERTLDEGENLPPLWDPDEEDQETAVDRVVDGSVPDPAEAPPGRRFVPWLALAGLLVCGGLGSTALMGVWADGKLRRPTPPVAASVPANSRKPPPSPSRPSAAPPDAAPPAAPEAASAAPLRAPPEPAPPPEPEPAPAPPAAPPPAPAPAPPPAMPPATPPAPAPAAQPAPAAAVARLAFTSDVPALVTVNGSERGLTPITVELPPGAHSFTAEVPGRPETRTGGDLEVDGDRTYDLKLQFLADNASTPPTP